MSTESDLNIWVSLVSIGTFLLACMGITTKVQNNKLNHIEEIVLTKDKHNDLCTIKDLEVDKLIIESEQRIIIAIKESRE